MTTVSREQMIATLRLLGWIRTPPAEGTITEWYLHNAADQRSICDNPWRDGKVLRFKDSIYLVGSEPIGHELPDWSTLPDWFVEQAYLVVTSEEDDDDILPF
jgi:hypothetical protein